MLESDTLTDSSDVHRWTLDVQPGLVSLVALRVFVVLTVLLAVAPSLYSVLWSFMGTEVLGILAPTPTLRWVWQIVADAEWRESLLYSTILALAASTLGTAALVVHFYYVRYARAGFDRAGHVMVLLVALVPVVVYALALTGVAGVLGLPEWSLLLMGQLIAVLPVQFFVVESAQEVAPDDLLFAGSTLGASHWRNLAAVYWPAVRRAAFASFVLGLFVAFDELVLATFLVNSTRVTAPRRLWDQINSQMDPSPAVVSCLLGATFGLCMGVPWFVRRVRSGQGGGES